MTYIVPSAAQEACPAHGLSGRLPLLITGITGVAGFNAFRYFQRRYPGQVIGIFGMAPVDLKLVDPSKPAWRYA